MVIRVEDNVLTAPIAISLVTLVIVVISYMDNLPALPTWPSHLILSRPSLRAPPHLKAFPPLIVSMMIIYLCHQVAKLASVSFVAQTDNAFACLTHTSSLGPRILDSSAFDHIYSNKDLFSCIATTFALPTITLANGSQTMAKGIGLAHPLPSLLLTYILYT